MTLKVRPLTAVLYSAMLRSRACEAGLADLGCDVMQLERAFSDAPRRPISKVWKWQDSTNKQVLAKSKGLTADISSASKVQARGLPLRQIVPVEN